MDPVSAVGLVGSIVGIADVVLRSVNRLSLLQTKYRQADFSVSLLIAQLFTVQVALNQFSDLEKFTILGRASSKSEWKIALTTSLDGCGTLVGALDEQLTELEKRTDEELSIRGKLSLLWRDGEIKECLDMLNHHVNALNLLLQVMQCKTSAEQHLLMESEDSTTVLRLARESTESMDALGDTSSRVETTSIFSQDTTCLSVKFDFDNVLLNSRAYHEAFKHNYRDAIRQRVNPSSASPDKNQEEVVATALDISGSEENQEAVVHLASDNSNQGQEEVVESASETLRSNRSQEAFVDIPPETPGSNHGQDEVADTASGTTGSNQSQDDVVDTVADTSKGMHKQVKITATAADDSRPNHIAAGHVEIDSVNPGSKQMAPTTGRAPLGAYSTRKLSPRQTRTEPITKSVSFARSRSSIALRFPQLRNFARPPSLFLRRRNPDVRWKVEPDVTTNRVELLSQSTTRNVKVLILGTSESGKSTFLRSTKLWGKGRCTTVDPVSSKTLIYSNLIYSMRVILENLRDPAISLQMVHNQQHVETILMQPLPVQCEALGEQVIDAFKALWIDSGIQALYDLEREHGLYDCASYYFQNLDRITKKDYIPNSKDILMSQTKTREITGTTFRGVAFKGSTPSAYSYWRLVDVGGTRPQRDKWIATFDDVDLVLFTVDACCYNKRLLEHEQVNRMAEALTVWTSIVNSRWFERTAFVLLFTKMDQLESALSTVQPLDHLHWIPHGVTVDQYKALLEDQFLRVVWDKGLTVETLFESLVEDPYQAVSKVFAAGEKAIYSNERKLSEIIKQATRSPYASIHTEDFVKGINIKA